MTVSTKNLRWVVLVVLALCSCDEDNAATDGGGTDAGIDSIEDAAHNLDELRVEGTVTLDYGSAATGVKVTARCGSKEFVTTTDEQGDYAVTADVKDCSPLVIEFVKDSYLPNVRVIHLPPPTSPVTVDVPLAELEEVHCVKYKDEKGNPYRLCVSETKRVRIKSTDIMWGWVVSMAGQNALDYFPGEFRQPDGKLIGFVGLTYFEMVDDNGAKLDRFQKIGSCVPVPSEALDWLGDVDASTDQVEMFWYGMDLTTGRWKALPDKAVVTALQGDVVASIDPDGICEFELGPDGETIPNFVPIRRSDLAAVRAETLQWDSECSGEMEDVTEIWVCGYLDGNGWYAWGVDMKHRSCYAVTATDQCNAPVPNVVFQAKGRDHGYRAETWTDWSGKACLEVIPSEPEGEDYNVDGLKGLPFWVNLTGQNYDVGRDLKSQQNPVFNPNDQKSCDTPASCVPLELEFELLSSTCSQ